MHQPHKDHWKPLPLSPLSPLEDVRSGPSLGFVKAPAAAAAAPVSRRRVETPRKRPRRGGVNALVISVQAMAMVVVVVAMVLLNVVLEPPMAASMSEADGLGAPIPKDFNTGGTKPSKSRGEIKQHPRPWVIAGSKTTGANAIYVVYGLRLPYKKCFCGQPDTAATEFPSATSDLSRERSNLLTSGHVRLSLPQWHTLYCQADNSVVFGLSSYIVGYTI